MEEERGLFVLDGRLIRRTPLSLFLSSVSMLRADPRRRLRRRPPLDVCGFWSGTCRLYSCMDGLRLAMDLLAGFCLCLLARRQLSLSLVFAGVTMKSLLVRGIWEILTLSAFLNDDWLRYFDSFAASLIFS